MVRQGWLQVCEPVPARVRRKVSAFLRCGDVRPGFVEVSCDECHQSDEVASRRMRSGFCPSFSNRRAVESGERLVALLPRVRLRQWTVSGPVWLRFAVVKRPTLLQALEARMVRAT